jgi:hypothetical protein
MTVALWVNQDTPQHTAAVELRRLAGAFNKAALRHEEACTRWQTAVTRLDHRLSRCELRHLFWDMEDARVQRDSAFAEWSRAFDAVRGEQA